jgi:hypothetical protein
MWATQQQWSVHSHQPKQGAASYMSSTNGRCNTNERGSSYCRRERKMWLLTKFSDGRCMCGHVQNRHKTLPYAGNHIACRHCECPKYRPRVPCWECGAWVWFDTMVVDRIIPGEQGGRYTRDNIRIHCPKCSGRQGQKRTIEKRYGNG